MAATMGHSTALKPLPAPKRSDYEDMGEAFSCLPVLQSNKPKMTAEAKMVHAVNRSEDWSISESLNSYAQFLLFLWVSLVSECQPTGELNFSNAEKNICWRTMILIVVNGQERTV
jgi:hypothetical protein